MLADLLICDPIIFSGFSSMHPERCHKSKYNYKRDAVCVWNKSIPFFFFK